MPKKKATKKKNEFERVYQFKISLYDIKPLIWRRVQVPETYTFWDLHCAIQDAMGWTDSHLHEFHKGDLCIGIPQEEYEHKVITDWDINIRDIFSKENVRMKYMYDFGDGWEHEIKIEKIVPREKDIDYPRCTGGERACPPEDCGGAWGYQDFLKAIQDPEHEQHEEMLEWIGGEFDPEYFDFEDVDFMDPEEHRKWAWG